MRKIGLILVLLFISGCNKSNSEKAKTVMAVEKAKPFFKFDEVEHYQVNDKDEVWNLLNVPIAKKTFEDKEFHKILMEYDYPSSINDSTFFKSLKKFYPTKNKISNNLFPQLSDIFSQRKTGRPVENACDPFFRDIFIFKENGKIKGVAKVCFECEMDYIVGADVESGNFGANKEFERLKKLIGK